MQKLQGCPFCGSEARMGLTDPTTRTYTIYCTKCSGQVARSATPDESGGSAMRRAANDWNTRKPRG